MKCPQCGAEFTPANGHHRFCSKRCRNAFLRGKEPVVPKSRWNSQYSISFDCAKCGRHVVTDPEHGDHRSRFCSAECEKRYWRHPPCDTEPRNQMFGSLGAMERREKWTNRRDG